MRKLLLGLLLTPVIVWGAGGEADREAKLNRSKDVTTAIRTNNLPMHERVLNAAIEAGDRDLIGYASWEAAVAGRVYFCKQPLRHGAPINIMSRSVPLGSLHDAAMLGHADVCELLLSSGADARIQGAPIQLWEPLGTLRRVPAHNMPLGYVVKGAQTALEIKALCSTGVGRKEEMFNDWEVGELTRYEETIGVLMKYDPEGYRPGGEMWTALGILVAGNEPLRDKILRKAVEAYSRKRWDRRRAAVVRAVIAETLFEDSAGEELKPTDGAGAAGGAGGS